MKKVCADGIMKMPTEEQVKSLLTCAEGKDKDKAAALAAFDKKPYSQKMDTFKEVMECKNQAV